MILKFKKLHPEAVIPKYAKPGDAGLDLTCVEKPEVKAVANEYSFIEYKTGLAVEIPEGFVGLLFPRSSISKKPLTLANSVGVIDSGYRGEIRLRFRFDISCLDGTAMPSDSSIYVKGDRVGQLILVPIPNIKTQEVEELSDTVRGEGGFGSTNVK